MALKPYYMLEGRIKLIKEVKLVCWPNMIERRYKDEYGHTAIRVMPDLKDKKV